MINNELLKKKILDEAIHGKLVENDLSLPPVDVEEIKKDVPFEIPNNWKWTEIKNVVDMTSGGTPSRNVKEYWENGNIPWVKISDMRGKYLNSTDEFITSYGLKNSSAKIFSKGTILYSIFATIGNVSILNIDATTNQAIVGLTPKIEIEINFLYYLLKYIKDFIKQFGKGTSQLNINQQVLKKTLIPLPPLEEQEKIVKKIEELFELIDRKEKNDKEKEKLKEVLKSKTLEEELPISDIAVHKLSDFLEKTYNVNWKDTTKKFCYIDLSSVDRQKHIIETTSIIDYNNAPSRAKQIVKKNDVLFGTTRPLLCRVCIVDEKYDNQICSTGFCVMRPKKDLLDSKFLEFIIRSSEFIKYIEPLQRGVSYPAVSDKDVYNYKISIPPLEQQKKIVEKIEKCFELIEQL